MAKDNFDTLQATVGDKMTVTLEEFDDIFSLICQDPTEHFELFDSWELGKVIRLSDRAPFTWLIGGTLSIALRWTFSKSSRS